jgi:phage baseplate assembly protein W
MALSIYRGFSTSNYLKTKQSFRLSDIDIVKRDLMNHIFTRKGERYNMPRFGTTIPDLVFEPLDDKTVAEVRQQLTYVFNYDPRVELIDISVFAVPELNGIIASAVLQYVELDVVNRFDLHLEFNSTN